MTNSKAASGSEVWLRTFLDTLGFGVVVQDADGVIAHANKAAAEILGTTLERLKGKTSADPSWRITGEDGEPCPPEEHPVSRARLSGEPVRGVIQGVYSGSARERWILTDAVPIKDPETGKVKEAVVSFVDITERKRAEEERLRLANHLSLLLESTVEGIYGIDLEGRCTFVNRAAAKLLGYEPEELIGKNMHALIHHSRADLSPYPEADCPVVNAFRTGKSVRVDDEVFWRKDGSARPVAFFASPVIERGKATGAVVTFSDISEAKKAENALRESEARFRTMADTAPVFIWMSGMGEGCIYFNKGWLDFTGRTLAEELGDGWLEGVHPDDYAFCVNTYESACDSREPFEMEYRLRRADGEYRWVFDRATPRFAPDGSFVGYIGSCTDVTERRRIREDLAARARQQAAVAELGQRALSSSHLQGLFDEAVALVASTLDADYCKVLELLRGSKELLLRAGVGWQDGLVGRATVGAELDSQAGYTLASSGPVIVENLPAETRFSGPPLLHEHGVVSGMSVVIQGDGGPFGVLGVHATSPRAFSQDDVAFLQSIANILSTAVRRRHDEEALRVTAERFRIALKGSPVTIFNQDLELRYTWIHNPALGYSAEEVPGKRDADLFERPEDAEAIEALKRRVLETARGLREEVRIYAQGRPLYYDLTVEPLYDASGKLTGVSCAAVDITERKEAEGERSKLLAREKEARVAAENAMGRLGFLSKASELLASSLDYETTLGNVARLAIAELADWCAIDLLDESGRLRRVALVHDDPFMLELAQALMERYPPDPNASRGVYAAMRAGRAALYRDIPESVFEAAAQGPEHLKLLRKFGMRSAIVVPLMVRGKAIGALTLVLAESEERFDDDDLALAEELARRAAVAVDNARLFREAHDTNEELEERVSLRTRQLEQINKELESFAYAVSHDLRTPLSGIDGFTQALLEDYGDTLDDTAGYYLERILFNTRRMGQLIDDILRLSRVSRKEVQLESVNLSALVADIVSSLKSRQPRRQVEVEIHEGIEVEGDSSLLRVALENLLDNAWKFTSQRDCARIEFGLTQEGGETVYFVKDNGAGFDMRYTHHLFHPFHRLHSDAAFQGTGIGLVTVKRIIERHGGRIWAEAEPDRGASFLFTLNAAKVMSHALD